MNKRELIAKLMAWEWEPDAPIVMHIGPYNDVIDSVELNYEDDGTPYIDLIGESVTEDKKERLRNESDLDSEDVINVICSEHKYGTSS